MHRVLLGAALGALLGILMAAPAAAVPANEVLIARNLQRLGIIPRYATPAMARGAVRALEPKGTEYPVKPAAGKASQSKALARFLAGRTAAGGKKASTYTANTLVLLVEFGDGAWPAGDSTGHDPDGPLHGEIPAPAADDNATFWTAGFSVDHYRRMLFGNSFPIYGAGGQVRGYSDDTMRTYYLEQSHGAYTVQGDIRDWVTLDLPESWYGADSVPWNSTDDLTGPVWRVARDAIVKFAGQNPDFDWTRYDRENPWGIAGPQFDRPDGYIDHLILVHAGSDQSAGGGTQQADAIWAHSWGIFESLAGGPGNGPGVMIPGTEGQGPQGKGIWAYNYTINPEDGDIGVFCHEFGHDLGLPDQYDYSSASGDATSGFWTLMASGSWLGREWGIGSKPAAMNVWDKSTLGFVKPTVVKRGRTATVKLQPAATGAPARTGVKISLPDAKHTIKLSGKDGAKEWYSGMDNDLDAVLAVEGTVPAGPTTQLSFRTWYEIEQGYDFGLVQVSAGGAAWHTVKTFTGTDTAHWNDFQTVDLSGYAGENIRIRFRYVTGGGVALRGWEIADVTIRGRPRPAFAARGWKRVDGAIQQTSQRYYIAEYRTYDGFDEGLRDCYQWNYDYGAWVDWFGYNRGLHLIYRDTFYADNDVAMHPGRGGWMVVDGHPKPDTVTYSDGSTDYAGYWRPRIQVRDASFSTKGTQAESIYFVDYDRGLSVCQEVVRGRPAQPRFDDARDYWFAAAPEAGTKIPKKLGVRIIVKSMNADGMTIYVDNKK